MRNQSNHFHKLLPDIIIINITKHTSAFFYLLQRYSIKFQIVQAQFPRYIQRSLDRLGKLLSQPSFIGIFQYHDITFVYPLRHFPELAAYQIICMLHFRFAQGINHIHIIQNQFARPRFPGILPRLFQ